MTLHCFAGPPGAPDELKLSDDGRDVYIDSDHFICSNRDSNLPPALKARVIFVMDLLFSVALQ